MDAKLGGVRPQLRKGRLDGVLARPVHLLALGDDLGDDVVLVNGNPEVEQSPQRRRHRSRGQRRGPRVGPHLAVAEQARRPFEHDRERQSPDDRRDERPACRVGVVELLDVLGEPGARIARRRLLRDCGAGTQLRRRHGDPRAPDERRRIGLDRAVDVEAQRPRRLTRPELDLRVSGKPERAHRAFDVRLDRARQRRTDGRARQRLERVAELDHESQRGRAGPAPVGRQRHATTSTDAVGAGSGSSTCSWTSGGSSVKARTATAG